MATRLKENDAALLKRAGYFGPPKYGVKHLKITLRLIGVKPKTNIRKAILDGKSVG